MKKAVGNASNRLLGSFSCCEREDNEKAPTTLFGGIGPNLRLGDSGLNFTMYANDYGFIYYALRNMTPNSIHAVIGNFSIQHTIARPGDTVPQQKLASPWRGSFKDIERTPCAFFMCTSPQTGIASTRKWLTMYFQGVGVSGFRNVNVPEEELLCFLSTSKATRGFHGTFWR